MQYKGIVFSNKLVDDALYEYFIKFIDNEYLDKLDDLKITHNLEDGDIYRIKESLVSRLISLTLADDYDIDDVCVYIDFYIASYKKFHVCE